ncbi:MAG TPA: helix-turn-helix domain-containing protein [Acidimicrobiales bacterium]|nr:helix-turn-helix domain-containing protein [Acidimicrobiales bacterium]
MGARQDPDPPPPPKPEERKGDRTRAGILAAAATRFHRDGFDGTTLADIADDLGITRSAVLHHFASKAALLEELVRPFMEKLDEVLDATAGAGPFTVASRRRFVVDLIDFLSEHHDVAALLTRDITVHGHLPADLQLRDRAGRFLLITQEANDLHPLAATRSLAALGTVVRPLASDDLVDFGDPATRALLVEAVLAVLKVPLPDHAA